jgi:hypothetical protein
MGPVYTTQSAESRFVQVADFAKKSDFDDPQRAYTFSGAYGVHPRAFRRVQVGSRYSRTKSGLSYLHGKTLHPNGSEPQNSFASIYQG